MFEKWKEERRIRKTKVAEEAAAASAIAAKKRAESEQIEREFQAKISSEDFGYRYGYEGTEYRIDMKGSRIYLRVGYVRKIYALEDVRDVERRWITPEKYSASPVRLGREGHMHAIGANVGANVATAMKNSKAKREAAQASGLFISVADIDHPMFQIMFSDQTSLMRSFEILHQAREGRLPAKPI